MLMETQSLLAFGNFRKQERIDLGVIAQEASLELEVLEDAAQAAEWLSTQTPRALLIDDSAVQAEHVCFGARSTAFQALTPIISLARELDDLSFADVFSWGGDDAVELSAVRPLLSRIRSLPQELAPMSQQRGAVVVADPDQSRRVIRARVLRNAGYTVDFAITIEDLERSADKQSPQLVVVDSELEGAEEFVLDSAQTHLNTRYILMCPPRHLARHTHAMGKLDNAAAADGFAPPENVVFLANELERGGAADKRATRRLLYGTKVCFRGAGRDLDDFGFSYNISEGGLYIRTLAPPTDDTVWLELSPPRSDRRVRLEGEVVWRRGYGRAANATVPPGFGVRITDATKHDGAAWTRGYYEFLRSLGHGNSAVPTPQKPLVVPE